MRRNVTRPIGWWLCSILCALWIVSPAALADQHAVDVSGRWVGTWTAPGANDSGAAELKVVQTGSQVTGTLELIQAKGFGIGPKNVTGTVRGSTFTFSARGGCPINAELHFAADRLEGYFNCTYPGNSLTLDRQD